MNPLADPERDRDIFERVIRADERVNEAHRRLDRHDDTFSQVAERMSGIETSVNTLNVTVGKLNVKVAVAAAIGSLVGGGAIAVLVTLIPQ